MFIINRGGLYEKEGTEKYTSIYNIIYPDDDVFAL